MAETAAVQVDCPQCDTRLESSGYVFVDADADTPLIAQITNGQLNLITCHNCGFVGRLPLPLVYHDARLEVVAAYVPDYQSRPAEEVREALLPIVAWLVENTPEDAQKPYLFQVQAVDDFTVIEELAQRSHDARPDTTSLPGLSDDTPITPKEQALLGVSGNAKGEAAVQELVEAQFGLLRRMIAATTPEERAALLEQHRAIADTRLIDILGILTDQAAQAQTAADSAASTDPTSAEAQANREAAANVINHLDTIKTEIQTWLA